jgi:L-fuculose-phosphate aldolase
MLVRIRVSKFLWFSKIESCIQVDIVHMENFPDEETLRRQLIDYGLKSYNHGFVTETEGNLSARLSDDRFLVTPSHVPYEKRQVEDIVLIDGAGNLLKGSRKPTTETRMHLAVYKARSDVNGIVHAHPVYCSILAVMGEPLPPILDEMYPYLGGVVHVTQFAPSGSAEIAAECVKSLGNRAAVLLSNHGNLCVGKNMSRAFQTAKYVEKYAQIYLQALNLKRVRLVPEERQRQQVPVYEHLKTIDW